MHSGTTRCTHPVSLCETDHVCVSVLLERVGVTQSARRRQVGGEKVGREK